MDYSITKDGKALSEDLYSIDFDAQVFSSGENNLVLDFNCLSGWTFKTESSCTFRTSYSCTFQTGSNCMFNIGYQCTFNTGNNCTFDAGYDCTFDTGYDCTFNTGGRCVFNTDSCCIFSVFDICSQTFKRGSSGVILDRKDSKHYLLNEEFIRMRRVIRG